MHPRIAKTQKQKIKISNDLVTFIYTQIYITQPTFDQLNYLRDLTSTLIWKLVNSVT